MCCKVLIFTADVELFFLLKTEALSVARTTWMSLEICGVSPFTKYSQGSHTLWAGRLQGCFLQLPLSLRCQLCATLSRCSGCFLLRGKFLFHQYGCTVFTHCKCCVAVSGILWGPASDEQGWRTGWGLAARGWEGFVGREGCSLQQQSLDCLCFIIWRQNFPAKAGGSQSTISRERELFTWKFLPHDAGEKPGPLDSARCSWDYCKREGEAELNKVGESPPPHPFFFFFFFECLKSLLQCAAFRVYSLGKPGELGATNSNVILAGDPGVLRNILIWAKEMAKLAWIYAACLGVWHQPSFSSKTRSIYYSTKTHWILGSILIILLLW